jgi:hypothetical protein
MTVSASSARPMSTRAAAASPRSRGATAELASASCRRSGPFCVVFQSWMFSELGFAQAKAVAATPIATAMSKFPGTTPGRPTVLTDGE